MKRTELDLAERRTIEDLLHRKMKVSDIARRINRHRASVYREIKRNAFTDLELPQLNGYYGMTAQKSAAERRARRRKLIKYPELCKRVIKRIKDGWTPKQISNEMIQESTSPRVCQETIYRYIIPKKACVMICGGTCPTHCVARRTRRRREPKFNRDVSILFRPDDVAHRRLFEHWEGDFLLFKKKLGQTNVTSLVERESRFAVILKNHNKLTKPVMGKIMKTMKGLPLVARKSIIFDRGTDAAFNMPKMGRRRSSTIVHKLE